MWYHSRKFFQTRALLFFFLSLNFLKFIFNWRVIALPYCVGFCCTTLWVSRKYTLAPWASLPSPHRTLLFRLLSGKWKPVLHWAWLCKALHCVYTGEEVAEEGLSELGLNAEFEALKQSFKWSPVFFGQEAHITFDLALLGIQLSYMFLLMVT